MSRRLRAMVPFVVVTAIALTAAVLTASPSDFEVRLQNLGSPEAAVRKTAVELLSSGSDKTRSDLLDELSGDHSRLAKTGMLRAVRNIGVTTGMKAQAVDMLRSEDAWTRQAGLSLSTDIATSARPELEAVAKNKTELPFLRQLAVHALGKAGAQSRSALLGALNDPESPEDVTHEALRSLAAISSEGRADVVAYIHDATKPMPTRRAAVAMLAHSDGRAALISLCSSGAGFAWLRADATAALATLADSQDTATLIPQTKDAVGDVRLAALRAIHDRSAGQGVRGAVIPLLQDADARVQALAAYHLGQNLAGDFINFRQQLLNMLGSGNFKVRYEAALALLAYKDKGGANTMLADQKTQKTSQRLQAADAYQRITSAR